MTNVLLIHGGGGPFTVASINAHLSGEATVIAPVLPGWNGTSRDGLTSVRDYGKFFADQLERDNLEDVVVVGSSVGGWIAAELALASSRVGKLVLIDAGGIEVDGVPITDVAGLAPQDIAKISFHDPSKFTPPPVTPESLAIMQANQASLAAINIPDPTLLGRLGGIHVPTLVLWGESDGVYPADMGRAYAAAIPGATFEPIPEAGHLPHLENAPAVWAALDAFVN
jgi:pimeloyl-ACP methyl ester carboxylesterase